MSLLNYILNSQETDNSLCHIHISYSSIADGSLHYYRLCAVIYETCPVWVGK